MYWNRFSGVHKKMREEQNKIITSFDIFPGDSHFESDDER